jgi:hypothetical protein
MRLSSLLAFLVAASPAWAQPATKADKDCSDAELAKALKFAEQRFEQDGEAIKKYGAKIVELNSRRITQDTADNAILLNMAPVASIKLPPAATREDYKKWIASIKREELPKTLEKWNTLLTESLKSMKEFNAKSKEFARGHNTKGLTAKAEALEYEVLQRTYEHDRRTQAAAIEAIKAYCNEGRGVAEEGAVGHE